MVSVTKTFTHESNIIEKKYKYLPKEENRITRLLAEYKRQFAIIKIIQYLRWNIFYPQKEIQQTDKYIGNKTFKTQKRTKIYDNIV